MFYKYKKRLRITASVVCIIFWSFIISPLYAMDAATYVSVQASNMAWMGGTGALWGTRLGWVGMDFTLKTYMFCQSIKKME